MSTSRDLRDELPFFAAWSWADEVLGFPGPAWLGSVLELRDVDSDDESTLLESLSAPLSQLGDLLKNPCYGRLSEWGHLGVYETVAHIYLSIPDLGMFKPAAWEGTDSFPWLRFIWCLIAIALKSNSPTWEFLLIPKSSFAHFKYGGCSSRRKKGWIEVRSIKISEEILGRSKNHCKFLPVLCVLQCYKITLLKTDSKSKFKKKTKPSLSFWVTVYITMHLILLVSVIDKKNYRITFFYSYVFSSVVTNNKELPLVRALKGEKISNKLFSGLSWVSPCLQSCTSWVARCFYSRNSSCFEG